MKGLTRTSGAQATCPSTATRSPAAWAVRCCVQEAGRRGAVVVEEDQHLGRGRPGAGVARRRRAAVLAAHQAQAEPGLAGDAVPGGRRAAAATAAATSRRLRSAACRRR